jgi:hypothetical protein
VWGTRIATPGQLGYADVSALRKHARVIVVPSTWDVFNFAAAEAMASGSVVVCSDGAGASGLIEAGRTGFVFGAGDPAALAEALAEALARTPAELEAIGRQARETVAARLDPMTVARARVGAYRDVVAGAVSRPAAADWLCEFFDGRQPDSVSTAFLDQFAIADLSRYLKRRASDRITARLRGVISR